MKSFLAIVDLNGTLVDTEYSFFGAYRDVLAEYDIPFTIENFTLNWSTRGRKLHDYLESIGRSDLLSREKELLAAKDRIFQETMAERTLVMPGVMATLTRLKGSGMRFGLDSSGTRENIDRLLDVFGFSGTFDAISSGDMVIDETKYGDRKKKSTRLKVLADTLGFAPEHCVVIGDAEKDVIGAKEAGMRTIAIPNRYTRDNDFSSADRVLTGFDDVTLELLSSLVTKYP